MFKTALLVVTKPLSQIQGKLPAYLSHINRLVSESAYISIHPNSWNVEASGFKLDLVTVPFTTEVRNVIKEFYTCSSNSCSKLDVRVLVEHLKKSGNGLKSYSLPKPFDIVLIDQDFAKDGSNETEVLQAVSSFFSLRSAGSLQSINVDKESSSQKSKQELVSCLKDTIIML